MRKKKEECIDTRLTRKAIWGSGRSEGGLIVTEKIGRVGLALKGGGQCSGACDSQSGPCHQRLEASRSAAQTPLLARSARFCRVGT